MKACKNSHLYYLLPFSLWEAVLLSTNLNLDTRKRILEITYFIFITEYDKLLLNVDQELPEELSKRNNKRISFY